MHGWFIDCIEKMILSNYGHEIWVQIKEKAKCSIEIGGWVRLQHYPDEMCMNLFNAATEILCTDSLKLFGQYFGGRYLIEHGYQNVLRCKNRLYIVKVFKNNFYIF